jgi:hypothetical protein
MAARTRVRRSDPTDQPLYQCVLGDGWFDLDPVIQRAHAGAWPVAAAGRMQVQHGRGLIARLLAGVLRLPRETAAASIQLVIVPEGRSERWVRNFADRRLETHQFLAGDGELGERAGRLELRFRLVPLRGSLLYKQVGVAIAIGPIRLWLPRAFAPVVDAREDAAGDNRVLVSIKLSLPLVGLLLAYGGAVEIEERCA